VPALTRSEPRPAAGDPGPSGPGSRLLTSAILAGGLLGAVLLLVAEFTTLYTVRASTGGFLIKSVSGGSNHSYALIPVALLAALLAYAVFRAGSRPALLAIGVLAIVVLLISLVGDLPDAHFNGRLVGSPTTHLTLTNSRPSAGFYMETLGALVLLITCVSGFLMLGAPPRPAPGRRGGDAT
jgi:hypothetical protein